MVDIVHLFHVTKHLSFLLILILSFLLAGVSFFFVDVDYDFNDIKPFLENTKLFVLNFLPILITMLVLFSVTGKLFNYDYSSVCNWNYEYDKAGL